ncbi:nucleoside/nucleotide kinase family protein [Roseococcus pinisoli]|uniref:Uncharacterized protein n=1 Tax=Roseococcus pinisoli TaxID=2835040 RepID=A0ABS5QG28_9PROT|nr:hypothetical protein [Roseococcus pinisoli]MBS7812333.1 hypothetical protein [Roseococcus pinisoli]
MNSFIALYSPASGSGKSTLANSLTEVGFVRLSLADPIREMALVVLGPIAPYRDWFSPEVKNVPVPELHGKTPTDLLIALGQGIRDRFYNDVWLDNLVARRKRAVRPVVCDDLRQPNEFDRFRSEGALLVKVVRDGAKPRGMDGLLEDREFDLVLHNDTDSPTAWTIKAANALAAHTGLR